MTKVFKTGVHVFRISKDHRNAFINYQDEAGREFGPYGTAFHEAGRSLAKIFLEKEHSFSDFEGIPIVYLYRHALELHLKGVVLAGNRLMGLEGEELPETQLWGLLSGHRMSNLLPHVQNIFRYVDWPSDISYGPIKTFADIQAIVTELESKDPSSFTFRYPTDKKGKESLEGPFAFSVRDFIEVLDPLLQLLGTSVN